jgi:hypothetical protein
VLEDLALLAVMLYVKSAVTAQGRSYSRPWVTSLYRYKFQTISSMSVLSGGMFSVLLSTEFRSRAATKRNVGLTPRRKQGNKD